MTTYRVYAQLEEGALLVRQNQSQNLNLALKKAAKLAQALYVEVREYCNGHEKVLK